MNYASIEEALVHGHGIERSFRCHVHDDTVASASVNSLTGLWFCYACGARGKYDVNDVPVEQWAASVRKRMEEPETTRVYSEAYLDLYDAYGPGRYWLSRFQPQTCRAFRLGHDALNGYATIPLRDPVGELLGIVRRDLLDREGPKYRYPTGVPVSELMFNYHEASGDLLLLTEGATDAIAAAEAGFPGAVASYRNGLSRAQQRLVIRYDPKRLIVAYDQDQAGHTGYQQVLDVLGRDVQVDRLHWTDYKDLAAIPLEDRKNMLENLG